MELKNIPPEKYHLLVLLSKLPERIIAVHGLPNATEFILHALCKDSGLPIQRAAYFVDNPDFDWCKGVAGFACDEQERTTEQMWSCPDDFTRAMQQSPFNQKVRSLSLESVGSHKIEELRERVKQELPLKNPACFRCNIKHDNIGILFVDDAPDHKQVEEGIYDAVYFLGMCPVF